MISEQALRLWVEKNPLEPLQVDCSIAVMLKILDGKCKMNDEEKIVMERLYDLVKHHHNHCLPTEVHQLIRQARNTPDEKILEEIYEQRVLAETMISRPVMKRFKAMLRDQGILSALIQNQQVE